MPVLTAMEDEEVKRSDRSFIHIENLPDSASRSDIRDFFNGLSIKKGGISIRACEAFVALEDPLDMVIALLQANTTLHGTTLQLSVIDEAELQKKLMSIARRKIDFGQLSGSTGRPETVQRKKIRPTPVLKGQKRRAMFSSTFNPQEITVPQPQDVLEAKFRKVVAFCCGAKKMVPTRVSESIDTENFAVFHPENCYEAKRIKLDACAA